MPALAGSTAYEELLNDGLTEEGGYRDLVDAARIAMNNSANEGIRAEIGLLLESPEELVSELTTSLRLHRLVQRSNNGTHFARSLPQAFKDVMRDLARRPESGALAYRIANTLRDNSMFEQVPNGLNAGKWISADCDPYGVWNEDENALVNATWSIEITPVTEWSGERRTPVCSDDDLLALLKAVLAEASAPLPATDIIRALRHRFAILYTEPEQLHDAVISWSSLESVEDQVTAMSEAERLLQILTPEEIVIAESGHLNVRELGDKLGCSKSAAATKRQKLRRFLSETWTGFDSPSSSENAIPSGDNS